MCLSCFIHFNFFTFLIVLLVLVTSFVISHLKKTGMFLACVGIGVILFTSSIPQFISFLVFFLSLLFIYYRRHQLFSEALQNPFSTTADLRPVPIEDIPSDWTLPSSLHFSKSGTYFLEIDSLLEKDGFPQSFIWRLDSRKRLSVFKRLFYFFADPILFTMACGRIARSSISKRIIPLIASHFKIDLSQYQNQEEEGCFKSFDDFFTRRFKNAPSFYLGASPCEGTIIYLARATKDQVLTIKGETLELSQLLGEEALNFFSDRVGVLITYLNPGNYHLGHNLIEGEVLIKKRILGKAWTVQPEIWNESIDGEQGQHYLHFNTRDVLLKQTVFGPVASIYVAATNVYSTEIHPELHSKVSLGAHEQTYHFGSTNVYVFDADAFYISNSLYPGKTLQVGKSPFVIPRAAWRERFQQ